MSPRVAYWCSSFDTDMEAIAKEVATLRTAFPGSTTWGVAARDWVRLSPTRGWGVHPRLQLLFRGITWLAQNRFDIQHLYGTVGDWFHLRAVTRKPIVLTVAAQAPPCDLSLLNKVDRFVVEWPNAEQELLKLGIAEDKIRLIYPPVDLNRFPVTSPPDQPFTIVFASSPEKSSWLKSRGVDLILDCARLCPEFRFVLIWRPWGDALKTVQQWIAERNLQNVEIREGRFDDMSTQYHAAHVTIAPFTDLAQCKPTPNSIVESLACGRPVVVTNNVGISALIQQNRAGVVTSTDALDLANGLRTAKAEYAELATNARALAELHFSQDSFIQSYRTLYRELI